MAPGLGFGEYGEGFVRIGLVENTQRLRQACRSIRHFMAEHGGITPTTQQAAPLAGTQSAHS